MRRRFSSRPTPAVSVIGAVVGGLMLIFGIVLFATVLNTQAQTPVPAPVIIFLGIWILAVAYVIIYHIANATKPGGVPTKIIESEDVGSPSGTAEQRLKELETLRNQELVSDAEYTAKRQEILKEI